MQSHSHRCNIVVLCLQHCASPLQGRAVVNTQVSAAQGSTPQSLRGPDRQTRGCCRSSRAGGAPQGRWTRSSFAKPRVIARLCELAPARCGATRGTSAACVIFVIVGVCTNRTRSENKQTHSLYTNNKHILMKTRTLCYTVDGARPVTSPTLSYLTDRRPAAGAAAPCDFCWLRAAPLAAKTTRSCFGSRRHWRPNVCMMRWCVTCGHFARRPA